MHLVCTVLQLCVLLCITALHVSYAHKSKVTQLEHLLDRFFVHTIKAESLFDLVAEP